MWKPVLVVLAGLSLVAAFNLPGVPLEFTADDAVLSAISDDIARKFEHEYMKFLETGVESAALRQITAQLAQIHSKKDIFTTDLDKVSIADQFLVCTTCRSVVNVLARTFRSPEGELHDEEESEAVAKRIVLDVCDRLKLQTPEVCGGLFDGFYKNVHYMIKNTVIESRTFCSLFMEFSFCNVVTQAEYNWSLNIDASGPAITGPKNNLPAKSSDDLHVLHLTDIHYDPLYEPDSLAECEEPLCCQRNTSLAQGTSKAAGYWGDYRECDLPWHTFENALEHIGSTHSKIDYIYQTGDIIDHMVWATSKEKNINALKQVNQKLQQQFPDVPIYPCIGNHEPHPLNLFSPESVPDDVSTHWLYEQLYEDWSAWLPASTKETILKGGYYTVSPRAGFRIIAVNSIFCYLDNYWLFFDGNDKIDQLQWLHDTLLEAEKNGEYVHILSHIPSGDGTCWSVWAREFSRIVERFSGTISGIFNGHTHKDEMNVYYSAAGHAIGLAWNGGALTSFTYKNPNYRVYEVEPTSYQVVDHETWIFDLNAANEKGSSETPNWYREYTFTAEFTSNLSPGGIDELLDFMATNPDKLQQFWEYKMTSAQPRLASGCGRGCLISTLCRMATTVNDQKTRCNELTQKLIETLDGPAPTEAPPGDTSTSSAGTTESSTSEGTTPETTTPEDDDDGGASTAISMGIFSVLALALTTNRLLIV